MKFLKKFSEQAMHAVFFLCSLISVAAVGAISFYLILSGLPAILEVGASGFFLGTVWDPTNSTEPKFGILPMILTSLYGTAAAAALGVPIGFFTALYLSKLAPKPVAAWIRAAVNLLAGIPSVVYGLVGMLVLVPALRRFLNLPAGDSLLAAIIVLAVMILPSVISVSEAALSAVPHEYEEGSLALGATEVETYLRVSTKAARSGLAASVVLGLGRAIGEAMAILMVAGNVANMPALLGSVRFLTTGIAIEMNYAGHGTLQRQALFSIGLTLFLFIFLINIVLQLVLKRAKE